MLKPPLLRLETFLPYRLNVLAAAVSEGLARVYAARFGIDIPGWRVLATLGQFGEGTATLIGQHSHMHKSKVSRAVRDLAERGLVEGIRSQHDGRAMVLSLTQEGRRIYQDIVPLALAYEQQLFDRLSAAERGLLDAVTARLTEEAMRIAAHSEQNPA
jgi:DNA-binding MarR family transcriptional regulator